VTGANSGYSPPTACRHTVSGTISLPSQGCFSPFPHGTGSLSVAREYLALEDGPPGFPRDFSCPAVLRNLPSEPACFRLRGCHPLWPPVPERSTSKLVGNSPASRPSRPYNPTVQARWFGLCPRSLAATSGISCLISLPAGTEMVHFPALPSHAYGFSVGYPGISQGGLPHSEISGSKPVCGSPELIAAYHVLHRLLAPRHSPSALSSLTIRTRFLRTRGRPRIRRDQRLHCVCVVGKNYRLQDIQLSKSPSRCSG
jgi:hypothetical protein